MYSAPAKCNFNGLRRAHFVCAQNARENVIYDML
jgi:hypothetical protein